MAPFTARGLIISLEGDRVFQIHFKSTSMGPGTTGESDFQRETESQSLRPGGFSPCHGASALSANKPFP